MNIAIVDPEVPDGADELKIAMGILGLIGVIVLGLLAYLAPSVTAAKRDHPRWASIVLLNLLLGWTVLGWIIAMAWAIRPRSSGSET